MLRRCTSPVFHGGELSRCRRNFGRSKPKFASLAADAESVTEGTQYGGGLPAEHRVVARISLIGGVTTEPSSQLDSDILLRPMGHVTAMAEQPSDSLDDIMAWRVGVSLPLYPTEPALARCCCVDDDAVTEGIAVVYSR
ncbi:hypothetical protein TcCL_NonESM08332 [Trypanosoma cruzi]|nr:hypothetical protein TcCL_NonESM08332 [Trypanosoma cruzi]